MTVSVRSRVSSVHATLRRGAVGGAVAALALAAAPVLAQDRAAGTATCAAASQAQVAALFDRWNASLATLDPDRVTANYTTDAVLLPTVTNEPRTTPAEIRDYFVKFLKNAPQGTIDKRTIKIGCNEARDVGTYTFRFRDGSKVQARYTFDYEWVNGQWLIAHHHSSAMPERR
ncbi:SgcJ/EcaC family oxidoreductase [Roseateles sp. SL47]|uniref:SgcJ/EcaC family oxidoreductase n=1 Tax=Roseateles sp. SL47 TaxID=2995138 RepID=UPI00226FA565|nr:SgcJ/EcaC family oxidoreductase [Roseateles sp. SL47]WAC71615.1 SgcJ/EcaC family oxidoreductase [Roseateles sp. SL47]